MKIKNVNFYRQKGQPDTIFVDVSYITDSIWRYEARESKIDRVALRKAVEHGYKGVKLITIQIAKNRYVYEPMQEECDHGPAFYKDDIRLSLLQ